uniref:ATP synthase subunit a n=2 Tax=Epiplatys TaxID=52655 RepID=A0A518DK39_9TELE|nr:ATP synthase F0 subunit 6 [Epiplatys multifasciatus]YP_009685782.1 ATP synthase F0 subunit 6 [Epiplatys spilargyreius]QDU24559.1 ATP synthase F0 subunit 6 [Epiplatys multifasciatus]QDU91875.1 ATP synthase F0 subunit 6 [Epiplatys spilargyreius]
MTLNLFDQFLSPTLLGIPLIGLALLLPWLLFPKSRLRWLNSRLIQFQNWFVIRFTNQLFLPINQKGHKWAALLTALMLFLISLNMLGLLPYTFTPTTQLSMSMAFAVPIWLATVLIGFRNQPNVALAHFLPEGTPTLLIPVLIIIETISLFIRPLALGVRLTANLTAGHLLMYLVSYAAFALISIMPTVAALTSILLFLLTILEVAVAMIQAYVFTLLLSLYLQENTYGPPSTRMSYS